MLTDFFDARPFQLFDFEMISFIISSCRKARFGYSPRLLFVDFIKDRLIDGLDRFASAMRSEVRRSVASRGLNPA
jgi:hypothetical protein